MSTTETLDVDQLAAVGNVGVFWGVTSPVTRSFEMPLKRSDLAFQRQSITRPNASGTVGSSIGGLTGRPIDITEVGGYEPSI